MICRSLVTLTLYLLTFPTIQLLADKEEYEAEPTQLREVLSSDFTTDTRSQYKIMGDVGWRPGRLTLAAGASIAGSLKTGARIRMKLRLDVAAPEKVGEQSITAIRLRFLGATDCEVRWIGSRGKNGMRWQVAVFDTVGPIGFGKPKLVREFLLNEHDPSGLWTVVYHYGLVKISRGDAKLGIAYLANATAPVTDWSLEQSRGEVSVRSAVIAATDVPPKPTAEQAELLAKAIDLGQRIQRLCQQGMARQAIGLAQQALRLQKEVSGTEHFEYGRCLNNLASVYFLSGKPDEAVRLLLQARRIWSKLLGNDHPEFATCLGNLASTYETLGQYSKAGPLFEKSLSIKRSALGKNNPAYARALNKLALHYKRTGSYKTAEPLYAEFRKETDWRPTSAATSLLGSIYAQR